MTLLAALLLAAAVLVWPSGRWVLARSPAQPQRPVRAVRARSPASAVPGQVLLQVIEAVGAQVRAGAPPGLAWDAAVEVVEGAADCLQRGPGEPVADALRRAAPRDRVVLAVAAAWALAEDVGAPLADVLDQLAVGLRSDADVDGEIEASLAGPRATARLLAALPVAGIAIGELIGAHPGQVLVATPVGRVCAVAGVALAVLGQLWSRQLVAATARLL